MIRRNFVFRDGEWRQISDAEFDSLPPPDQKRGLGDIVAAVATPIARALHLPCIDPATNELRPDSDCAKRKAWLNSLSK